MAKGKWQVFSNVVCGEKYFQVKRIINTAEPVHSGNLENSHTGLFNSKEAAQAVADKLNEEEV